MPNATSDTAIRQLLEARERELAAEVRSVQARDDDAGPREATDMKDGADRSALAEVAMAEVERDMVELRAVQAARQRLDEGRYGLCDDCGEAIAPARLQAQPTAARCIRCQSAAEHRH